LKKGKEMKFVKSASQLAILAAACLLCLPAIRAQQASPSGQQQKPQQGQTDQNATPGLPSGQEQAAPAKPDPAEEAAYKEIYDTGDSNPDKVIQLGEPFVQKYPSGKYTSEVYGRLVSAYYNKQEIDKMYAAGDKALALNPDNVNALVLVGWVIPHFYNPDDMDSDRKLDKAEGYLKHAIALFGTMQKPPQMTDDQFAKAKNMGLSQAHSGLGLVYFRRGDTDNSIKELQLAESLAVTPDPTDFYVMGVEFNSEKKYTEALDAFNKCAAQPGGLQGPCKQSADQAKKAAASAPK
jgi:tetratricopeptide (TPR) repeat protein